MTPRSSSQSVSQLFHGPTPRSPLYRLSIRLLFTKYHGPVSQSVISRSHPALTTGSQTQSGSAAPVQPQYHGHNMGHKLAQPNSATLLYRTWYRTGRSPHRLANLSPQHSTAVSTAQQHSLKPSACTMLFVACSRRTLTPRAHRSWPAQCAAPGRARSLADKRSDLIQGK